MGQIGTFSDRWSARINIIIQCPFGLTRTRRESGPDHRDALEPFVIRVRWTRWERAQGRTREWADQQIECSRRALETLALAAR